MAAQLSELDRAILDFEGRPELARGHRESAIRDRFDVSPTRYYQVLNALIEQPDALAYAPSTVKRLLRLRDRRSMRRAARRVSA